jgi:hypothetical protein
MAGKRCAIRLLSEVARISLPTNAVDLGLGVKWHNVIGNLGLGGGEFGQGGNVAISNGDDHGDAGVGESVEDVRVGVEYLNAADGGLGFEKGGDFGRWWEVVGDGAVVDADGVCRIKQVFNFFLLGSLFHSL